MNFTRPNNKHLFFRTAVHTLRVQNLENIIEFCPQDKTSPSNHLILCWCNKVAVLHKFRFRTEKICHDKAALGMCINGVKLSFYFSVERKTQ